MAQDTDFSQKIERIFDQRSIPLIMGILNVTPDSFFDGGKYLQEQDWLAQTSKMIQDGADIIDIGACSTRPGSPQPTEIEEFERLIKVIKSVRKAYPEILISVDTYRAKIAEQAVNAGANIVNDISGGTLDSQMFEIVAKLNVPYVLMHIQGNPQTMQKKPVYTDVVKEVHLFFEENLKKLNALGVKQVILDPGFGFGKTVEHNSELLNNLAKFQSFKLPVLVGISRKSFVNKILNINSIDTINATYILNKMGVKNGAKMLRVHDVKEAVDIVKNCEFLKEEN